MFKFLPHSLSFACPTPEDIAEIVKLQQEHFDKFNDRSISWRTSSLELGNYLDFETSVIARNSDDGSVVGYLMNVTFENALNFQHIKLGLNLLPELFFDNTKLSLFRVCVGQIFIAKDFRGLKLGSKLYQFFLNNVSLHDKYDLRFNTVAFTNYPSLYFHRDHLNMKIIGVTGTSLKDSFIMVLDLR